jgi:ribosomal protein S18 acetylase RimI-like enzyme
MEEGFMPLKEIQLPGDLLPLAELAIESFQYPENPAWNYQEDESTETVEAMKQLKRTWPLIRLLTFVSPVLRDILRGYFWVDETGHPVGSAIIQRMGSSRTWVIGNVAVLPSHRRQGIGRKLLQASLEMIRSRGGERAWLEVVKGNLPAYEMYLDLGFKPYSTEVVFERNPPFTEKEIFFPPDTRAEALAPFHWQPRYQLDLRIVPEAVQAFEPVEISHFRQPIAARLLRPIIMLAQGVQQRNHIVREESTSAPLAVFGCRLPMRGKGLIMLRARVDPGRPDLAEPVVHALLNDIADSGVNLRAEWIVPDWMSAVIQAAEEAGFRREYEAVRMSQSTV